MIKLPNLYKKQNFFFFLLFGVVLSGINSKSLLLNWPYISPDGFDTILEGRLIGTEDLVLPILRNPGIVMVSKFDALFGGFGAIFWASNTAGLTLQCIAIQKYASKYLITPQKLFLILAVYFLSYIHFISLFILADTIAIGIMCYAVSLILTNDDITKVTYLKILFLILISSFFQSYCLISLIPFTMSLAKSGFFRCILQGILGPIGIYVFVTKFYQDAIPHLATPVNFPLLKLSLDMSSFYFNTWLVTFGPILVLVFALLSSMSKNRIRPISKFIFLSSDLIPGYSILFLTFFYQWPESRFTYVSYSLIAPILLIRTVYVFSKEEKKFRTPILNSHLIFIAALGTVLVNPQDSWKPKIADMAPGKLWIAQAFVSALDRDQSSPYKNLLTEVDKYCNSNNPKPEIREFASSLTSDPYTQSMISLSLRYCVYK